MISSFYCRIKNKTAHQVNQNASSVCAQTSNFIDPYAMAFEVEKEDLYAFSLFGDLYAEIEPKLEKGMQQLEAELEGIQIQATHWIQRLKSQTQGSDIQNSQSEAGSQE